MIKILLVFLVLSQYKPGLGLILGIPTGINLNLESKPNALNASLAWGIPDAFYASFSYHSNFRVETSEDIEGDLKAYLGCGALVKVSAHDVRFGVKVPLGLKFFFKEIPIDIFADISPGVHLIPETSPLIEGAIGVRYYFGRVKIVKE
jgi:hypothetical protein